MAGSANIRETKIALSFRKQAALQVPAASSGNYWSLTKTNPALADITLNSETDAADIGKGHEFAENVYLTNWDARIPFEKFCSSEIMAQLFCFGLGKITKTNPGTGVYKYVCTPLDPVTDDIDMPVLTYVESIRQGGSALFDRAAAGCAVQSFGLNLASGPGRANARVNAELVGCGIIVDPSGITIPQTITEHFLNAGSAQITILGQNYVTLKRIVSLETSWGNALRLDQGFYPGSGSDNGGAVRGRMEHGDRTVTLSWVARMASNSTELTNLLNQTEGTAVIALTGAHITGIYYHSISMTYHHVKIKTAVIGDDSGIVTIQTTAELLYDSSDGIVTFEAITGTDNIGSAEV